MQYALEIISNCNDHGSSAEAWKKLDTDLQSVKPETLHKPVVLMRQEMNFLFRHFRPLKFTLRSLAKFHAAKNICTAPYLIDLCAEMSWLVLSSWIIGNMEVAEKSLLRLVPVGLSSFHSSGHFCCLKRCCTALTYKHSHGTACISTTQILFSIYYAFTVSLCASTAGGCGQHSWNLCPSLKKVNCNKRTRRIKIFSHKPSKKLHPTSWFPTCIPSYNRDIHTFFRNIVVSSWKYRPSSFFPAFTP